MKRIVAGLVIVSLLSGCTESGGFGMQREDGRVSKAGVGTLAGAGLGAVLGSNVGGGRGRIAAIALGTLLGAGLGNSVGSSLDRADMQYYNQSSQGALERMPDGQASTWHNPNSGNSGTITPTSTYQMADGNYCREYNQTINVGGKTESAYGKACRQPDGSWKIIQ